MDTINFAHAHKVLEVIKQQEEEIGMHIRNLRNWSSLTKPIKENFNDIIQFFKEYDLVEFKFSNEPQYERIKVSFKGILALKHKEGLIGYMHDLRQKIEEERSAPLEQINELRRLVDVIKGNINLEKEKRQALEEAVKELKEQTKLRQESNMTGQIQNILTKQQIIWLGVSAMIAAIAITLGIIRLWHNI